MSTRSNPTMQTKLIVGPAGDKYEMQADRIAKQVVRRYRESTGRQNGMASQEIQRDSSDELEEELQLKPQDVQRQERAAGRGGRNRRGR